MLANQTGAGPLGPLAVTMGDPAGIGPDVTVAAWAERAAFGLPVFFCIGDAEVYRARAAVLGLDIAIAPIAAPDEAAAAWRRGLPVLAPDWPLGAVTHAAPLANVTPGTPSQAHALAVIASIETAVRVVHAGAAAAVVSNPIAKSVLYEAGFSHPGHTEFLGALATRFWPDSAATRPVMMIASEQLRVVPVTIHMALADVPAALTPTLLEQTLRTTARALIEDFALPSPRLVVTGLNPHAGEAGTMGLEEQTIIAPVIAALQREGLAITGPHPADTLFHAGRRETYDCAVTMYHDQGLIPVKTLAFDSGVNVTLGLPFVRTSPDHGTAFDIAGSGRANPESFVEALLLADTCAARRFSRTLST